jgi:hypothetical protein
MSDDDSDRAMRDLLGRAAGDPRDPPIERIRSAAARRRARQRAVTTFAVVAVFSGAFLAVVEKGDDDGASVAAQGPPFGDAAEQLDDVEETTHEPPEAPVETMPEPIEPVHPAEQPNDSTAPTSDEPIPPDMGTNIPAKEMPPTPAPEPSPVVEIHLGVFDDNSRPAEGLTTRQLALGGNLEVEGGCVWALPGDDDPDSRPIPLEWRNGTFAHFGSTPGSFEVSQDGNVVARNGDRVTLLVSDWPAPAARCQSVSSRQPLRVFGTVER